MTSLQDRVELISFRICPFVMRTQITALEKGVELNTTYIDLANKPQWFLDLSPTGAVPAIKIDGYFIFESTVIADLIDELTPGTLYPEDAVQKAYNKSWIDYASTLLFRQFAQVTSQTREEFDKATADTKASLDVLETQLQNSPFWNRENFSIIEAAYAPFFHRHELFKDKFGQDLLADYPKLVKWSEAILANQSVQKICNEELVSELFLNLEKRNSYFLQLA